MRIGMAIAGFVLLLAVALFCEQLWRDWRRERAQRNQYRQSERERRRRLQERWRAGELEELD